MGRLNRESGFHRVSVRRRTRAAAAFLSAATCLGVGCRGARGSVDTTAAQVRTAQAPASTPAAVAAAPDIATAPDSEPFLRIATAALGAIRPSVSAADWMRAHPGDRLESSHDLPADVLGGEWCLAAIHEVAASDGLLVRRYAFFYVPPTPPDLALPADADTSGLAARGCRLGAIWIQASSADTVRLARVADSLRTALTGVYGAMKLRKTMGPPPHFASRDDSLMYDFDRSYSVEFSGSGGWTVRGRWESDSLTVVSALSASDGDSSSHGRVLAFAYEPVARLDLTASEASDSSDTTGSPAWRDSVAAVFVRFAGVAPDSARRLAGVMLRKDAGTLRLATAARWVAQAATLAPPERAAALVAADLLTPENLEPTDSLLASRFADAGIAYRFNHLGDVWWYQRTLLAQSAQLAPESPAGRWARLEIMDLGFNLTGTCGGGDRPFDRVAQAGLALLADEPDSAGRGETELLVAEGYADVVALASGAVDRDYVDPADYRAQVPEARRNAVMHYRAAFALVPASRAARHDWPSAWRLVAGLPIFATHFFCVYD